MKTIFLLFVYLFILSGSIFCQCPTPGIKIQSPVCESPKNLIIKSISCEEMEVKWLGNKNQAYILQASFTDPATKIQTEAKTSKIPCDQYGNCVATIFVKEGSEVSWSVQAICIIENAILYSAEINGGDSYSLYCKKANGIVATKEIRVYPNPTTGYLIVEYPGNIEGNIHFNIFDATGKKVFQNLEAGLVNNHYTLDLRRLVNGIYMLEMNNGKKVNVVKFELLRN